MNNIKNYILLSLIFVSNFSSFYNDSLRYFKYFMLPITLIFFIKKTTNTYLEIRKYYYSFISLYGIVSIITFFIYFFQLDLDIRYFANILFVFSAIIPAFYISITSTHKNIDNYLHFLFWGFVVLYSFELLLGSKFAFLFTNNYTNAIYDSNIATESGLSFVFSLFYVYFLILKKKPLTILSLILTIISFKRITILVLIISTLIYFIPEKVIKNKKNNYFLFFAWISSLFAYLYLAINFGQGKYDDAIFTQFNMSANHLTQGRQTLYKLLIDNAGYISWTGIGIGRIDIITYRYFGSNWNIHSDILKLYFEFGIILFSAWLSLIFKYHIKSKKLLIIISAFVIILLTDNIFIYLQEMLVFYLITTRFLMEYESSLTSKSILKSNQLLKSNKQ